MGALLRAKPFSGSCFRLSGFLFPILWRCAGIERTEKAHRGRGDFIDCNLECGFVRLRWFVKAGDLSDELNRGGSNLFIGDGWIEVEQSPDIPAHAVSPPGAASQRSQDQRNERVRSRQVLNIFS
jgi:hypothetical protein